MKVAFWFHSHMSNQPTPRASYNLRSLHGRPNSFSSCRRAIYRNQLKPTIRNSNTGHQVHQAHCIQQEGASVVEYATNCNKIKAKKTHRHNKLNITRHIQTLIQHQTHSPFEWRPLSGPFVSAKSQHFPFHGWCVL